MCMRTETGHFFMGMIMELKPALTIDQQVQLLKSRGMIFENENKAKSFLLGNNYYRLNIYFHLKQQKGSVRFRSNTKFEDIIAIYHADSVFRHAMLIPLEKTEITLRTRLAHYLALNYGPDSFYNQNLFTNQNDYKMLQDAFDKEKNRNARDPQIVHHNQNYAGFFPIWVIVEFLSFNTLSKFYNSLIPSVKKRIAGEYYNLNEEFLSSWLHTVSVLRNICAHYGFLYCRKYTSKPKLGNYFNPWSNKDNDKLMAQLLVLRKLSGANDFEQVYSVFQNEFIPNDAITIRNYGLPQNWESILRNIR